MNDHDTATRAESTTDPAQTSPDVTAHDPGSGRYVEFLRQEFPDWDFEVATTESWNGSERDLWVARQDGHHPQSELTAAKLHTRLSNYVERARRRFAGSN